MLIIELFYGVFWSTMFLVIWFNTDAFIYYSQLFNVFENSRLKFSAFLFKPENKFLYYPDFLASQALKEENRFKKFVFKLLSCYLCLNVWITIFVCIFLTNLMLIAPIYLISLVLYLGIKRLL
jgi:hypothetical protein